MTEYFVVSNSNAAPFVSDTSMQHVMADSPDAAVSKAMQSYSHPCGLYSLAVFASADAMHKGAKPLARWLSERAAKEQSR